MIIYYLFTLKIKFILNNWLYSGVKIMRGSVSLIIMLLYAFSTNSIDGQVKIPEYSVETGTAVYSGQQVPFWLMSNQYGLITPYSPNQWIIAGTQTCIDPQKKIDYDYGLELVNRYSNNNNLILQNGFSYIQQGYGRLKFYFLNLQAGVIKEQYGNQDNSLSSGGLYWSGNARPMPKVMIQVPDYTPVPYTDGYVEFKGGIAHGWFDNNVFNKNTFLHQKYVYVQFGGDFPVNIHYGLHQFTQWGGTDKITGETMPHNLQAFVNVILLRHLNKLTEKSRGSRNFGANLNFGNIKVDMYWQTLIEDGTGIAFVNISDGLWGISIHSNEKKHFINRFVYEYIKTTNQSGTYDSFWLINGVKYYNPPPGLTNPDTSHNYHESGGNDNYFNGVYHNGWTYHQMCIGTPLVTSPLIANGGLSSYIINNKIQANHIGIEGEYKYFNYKLLYTYIINYGVNTTSPGVNGIPINSFNPPRTQNSFLLKTTFSNLLPWKLIIEVSAGIDMGKMYGNNTGLMFSLIKRS